MKTFRLNSKHVTTIADQYILDCIDTDEPMTDVEKLQYLADYFIESACYPYNLKRIPNHQARLADWLMGLPIGIDFEHYRIIQLAKEWQTIPQDASEKLEDKVIANWFNFMAFRILKLWEKYNIELVRIDKVDGCIVGVSKII